MVVGVKSADNPTASSSLLTLTVPASQRPTVDIPTTSPHSSLCIEPSKKRQTAASGRTLAARMKAPLIWATFLASTVLSDSLETSPFLPPHDAETTKRAFEALQLLKRSNLCPVGYNPCTDLGSSKVCCQDGTNCSRDAADNIACCPAGASCTGSLTESNTGSNSFMFSQVAPSTTTVEGPTITGAAYPFVDIPTSFANAESCSSYYTLCRSQYSECTANLGAQYGVTVAGPSGAGVTIPGRAGITPAAAVCSSLSMQACHGLQLAPCNTYSNWRSNENIALPRRTSVQDLVFGLAVGVAGIFV